MGMANSTVNSVVLVDAVRTPFGKAGSLFAGTRADDLMVRCLRGLLERNPNIDPKNIDDVSIAAATQAGDQGMNIGRSASLLAGIPNTVPGYSIDRWCAGAMTAVTTIAGSILAGTIGFQPKTSWLQLFAWLAYLGVVIPLYLRPTQKSVAKNSLTSVK